MAFFGLITMALGASTILSLGRRMGALVQLLGLALVVVAVMRSEPSSYHARAQSQSRAAPVLAAKPL